MLKLGIDVFSPIISYIYNLSIQTGEYPSLLNVARIMPILKKGDKTNINNFRPISILPNLNKIFEKLTLAKI